MRHKRFKKVKYQYNLHNSNELIRIQSLSLLHLFLNINLKILFLHKMFNIIKLKTNNRLRHYCSITGRSRGIYSKFNVSRIKLRDLLPLKLFTGLKKIS